MNCTEALKILEPLAEGVNPTTGEVLPADSPFQQGQVVRALACAVELAKREIRKSELPQGAGKPWTQEEDAQLRRKFHQKLHLRRNSKNPSTDSRRDHRPTRQTWRTGTRTCEEIAFLVRPPPRKCRVMSQFCVFPLDPIELFCKSNPARFLLETWPCSNPAVFQQRSSIAAN